MDKEQIIARCVEACLELEGALRVLAERDDCAEAESLVERCRLQLDTLLDTLLDSQAPEYDVTPVYETTVEPAAEVFLEATDESTAPVVVPAVESEAEPSQTEGADEEAPSDETAEEQPAAGKPRTATDVTINDAYAAMDDEAAPVRPNELRVDEMLSRRGARELRRAFTLNDKFRFRRELANCRSLPTSFVRDMILKAPGRDMMNILSRCVLALYAYDENPDDISVANVLRQSL